MSASEVEDKASVARSEVSVKTNSPPFHRPPPLIDQNSVSKFKSRRITVNKIYKVFWSILVCLIVSCSLIGFVESAKLSFVSGSNSTITIVNPPSFLTYLSTSWLISFYPLQCITHIFRKEKKNDIINNLKLNLSGFFPESMRWYKYVFRMFVLVVLWNIITYSIIKSSNLVPSVDIVVIFCTNSSTMYLLHWVMLHKKFVALRIIAFILSSSGMIVNVYDNTSIIWYKILISTATVAYAVFHVYTRSIIVTKNQDHISLLYTLLGLVNTLFVWPIFVFTSLVTSAELITWNNIPWNYFIGCGISIFTLFLSTEIAHLTSTRGMRNLLFIAAIPIIYIIDTYWLKALSKISDLQIVSLVLVIVSILLASTPSSWMNLCSSKIFKKHSPYQMRRVSISARSNLIGNGGVRMSASLNNSASSPGHRDSLASEMLHKIGNISTHIFASQKTRQRLGSIFG
uniref:Slc35f-3 n=1 Tax=Schmidtea mediterranea TaxID=79327 RepID=A0A0H3YKG3_SCHMD|nr:slc35f-3 [Schmidtea mediterranea]